MTDRKTSLLLALRTPYDLLFGIKRCPFCIEPAPRLTILPPPPTKSLIMRDGGTKIYHCAGCQTDFVPQDGFMEPLHRDIRPTYTPPPLLTPKPSRMSLSIFSSPNNPNSIPTLLSSSSNTLCHQCNHHQEMMIHLLLCYEDMNNLKKYQKELESRYPLCSMCQYAVTERLKRVAYQVKAKSMYRGRHIPSTENNRYSRRSWLWKVFFSGTLASVITINSTRMARDIRYIHGIYSVALITSLWTRFWYHIPLFILAALSIHHNFYETYTIACCASLALVLPHCTKRSKPSPVNFPEINTNFATPQDLSASFDKSWSLGSTPEPRQRPKNSPFPGVTLPNPKKFDERKHTFKPATTTSLKPTQLEYKKPLGIESLMQSFSIQEGGNATPQRPNFALYSLKLVLVLIRFSLDSNQVVACLYAGNFYALSQYIQASTSSLTGLLRSFCVCRLFWIVIESFGGSISLHLPPIPILSEHAAVVDTVFNHGKTFLDIILLLFS